MAILNTVLQNITLWKHWSCFLEINCIWLEKTDTTCLFHLFLPLGLHKWILIRIDRPNQRRQNFYFSHLVQKVRSLIFKTWYQIILHSTMIALIHGTSHWHTSITWATGCILEFWIIRSMSLAVTFRNIRKTTSINHQW